MILSITSYITLSPNPINTGFRKRYVQFSLLKQVFRESDENIRDSKDAMDGTGTNTLLSSTTVVGVDAKGGATEQHTPGLYCV